jgi:hypothetical protein
MVIRYIYNLGVSPAVITIKVGSIQKRVAAITKLVPEYMLLMITSPNTNVN